MTRGTQARWPERAAGTGAPRGAAQGAAAATALLTFGGDAMGAVVVLAAAAALVLLVAVLCATFRPSSAPAVAQVLRALLPWKR